VDNPTITVEFNGDVTRPEWHRVYVDACRDAALQSNVDVVDLNSPGADRESGPALLVRVIAASDVGAASVSAAIAEDAGRQAANISLALGISAFGDDAVDAVQAIVHLIGQGPAGIFRWIQPAGSPDELRSRIVYWVLLVVDRRALSPAREFGDSPSEVILDQLPTSTSDAAVSRVDPFGKEVP